MHVPVELQGVPETLLWTLYHRASEARRDDAVLNDPRPSNCSPRARRLPAGALVFDAVPRWLSERSRSGKLGVPGGWHPPPWTWWIDADEKRALRESPHIADLRTLRLPRGRGVLLGYVMPLLGSFPGLRGAFLSIMLARFRS
jgi:hypothetical protein